MSHDWKLFFGHLKICFSPYKLFRGKKVQLYLISRLIHCISFIVIHLNVGVEDHIGISPLTKKKVKPKIVLLVIIYYSGCVCVGVCVCVCVCVCARACVRVCLYLSTLKAPSVWNDVLDILEGTDQQSYVEGIILIFKWFNTEFSCKLYSSF